MFPLAKYTKLLNMLTEALKTAKSMFDRELYL